MRIQVEKAKLVLGRTVYRKGDIFECRDQEARMLIMSKLASDATGKALTKEGPKAPTTGVSVRRDRVRTAANELEVAKKVAPPPKIVDPPKVPPARRPRVPRLTDMPSAVKPVGAITQPTSPAAPATPAAGSSSSVGSTSAAKE